MPQRVNAPVVGQRFGRLVVQAVVGNYTSCLCDCGRTTAPRTYRLWSGHTTSCGCYGQAVARKHGHTSSVGRKRTSEYQAWENMRRRCTDPRAKDYEKYGGRGVTICERWYNSFAAFIEDLGPKAQRNLTLERIDNERGYEPGNVRWATWKEQYANKRPQRWRRPYWKRYTDAEGEYWTLVIPKHLPPDWQMPVSC